MILSKLLVTPFRWSNFYTIFVKAAFPLLPKVQFNSVQILDRLGRRRDMTNDSAESLFKSFLREAVVGHSGMGRDVHSLTLLIQRFLCTPPSPPSQHYGALKDGFGEAVVARDIPEPCKFPCLDSCQKKLPWRHKEVDLAQQLIVGFVEKLAQSVESLNPFLRVSTQSSCFTATEENRGDRRLVHN